MFLEVLQEHFYLTDIRSDKEVLHFYFSEKNVHPKEFQKVELVSKSFYEKVTIQDFPLRGKQVYTNATDIRTIGRLYGVRRDRLQRQQKGHLSDFKDCDQLIHAKDWLLFQKNIYKLNKRMYDLSQKLREFSNPKQGKGITPSKRSHLYKMLNNLD